MDAVERAIWTDIDTHECGCWTWKWPSGCNIVRLLAELVGNPLPVNMKMYRMPECEMGSDCVNPEHVGSSEQWMARVSAWSLRKGNHVPRIPAHNHEVVVLVKG